MLKPASRYFCLVIFCFVLLPSCVNYKRLVTDEVVLKDQNSQTGTIIESDSAKIKLKKIDESIMIIKWDDVDTVIGKKLKTAFIGASIGYYNIPYFSVFRNEAMTGHAAGYQYKIGYAYRSNNLCYFNYLFSPATPYAINKLGVGYQRYLGTTSYLKRTAFYFGGEANIMNVKNNNGAQFCIEPFTGYELKLAAHVRMYFKFGLQLNLANKNSSIGSNFSLGFNFLRKNFKKRYEYLNIKRRIYGQ